MKITQLETIRLGEFHNIIWVGLRTGEGVVGLGETFMGAQAVEAYLHAWVAAKLLGKDPLLRRATKTVWAIRAGVALASRPAATQRWTLPCGTTSVWAANMPVHTALGGKSRDAIRIYNTCADYQNVRRTVNQNTANWGARAARRTV